MQLSNQPRLVVQAAVGRFIDNNDLLWASALTYTTALSIVPLLVLVFSVLKGLGYTDQLEPVVTRYVGSPDIASQLLGFVHNMKVGALGSIGAATLIITDISLLSTIENAFNHSWGVPQGRSYLRKFTDYLSITFVVPLLLVTALTLTAGFTKSEALANSLSFIASFVLVWAGYFVLFIFFPNTRVEWRAALIGALITAVLWTAAQWAYVHFQYGVTSYRAYYGALAAIPIFLVWIYFSWAIVLLGVEFAVVMQRGPYRPLKETIGAEFTRQAVLLILMRIGERMTAGGDSVSVGSIANELGVSEEKIDQLVTRLEEAGFIAQAETTEKSRPRHELLLTRSPANLRISEALEYEGKVERPLDARIQRMIGRIDDVERNALRDATVLDLIEGSDPAVDN
jgi:membrane protein